MTENSSAVVLFLNDDEAFILVLYEMGLECKSLCILSLKFLTIFPLVGLLRLLETFILNVLTFVGGFFVF